MSELLVTVEIPKGSRNKYEWDAELGAVRLDRFLFSSVVYPADYGMVAETLAPDGDPLDAMVCLSEGTFPGCLIEAKAVALLCMADEKGQDDKVICVPRRDPNWSHIDDLDQLPAALRGEIEHFFSVYKHLEGHEVRVEGWQDKAAATLMLTQARQSYQTHRSDQAGQRTR